MAAAFHKLIEVQILVSETKTTAWQRILSLRSHNYLILYWGGAGLRTQLGNRSFYKNYQFINFFSTNWIKSSALSCWKVRDERQKLGEKRQRHRKLQENGTMVQWRKSLITRLWKIDENMKNTYTNRNIPVYNIEGKPTATLNLVQLKRLSDCYLIPKSCVFPVETGS